MLNVYSLKTRVPIGGNFHSDLNLMACKEYCWWVLTLDGNVYVKEKKHIYKHKIQY